MKRTVHPSMKPCRETDYLNNSAASKLRKVLFTPLCQPSDSPPSLSSAGAQRGGARERHRDETKGWNYLFQTFYLLTLSVKQIHWDFYQRITRPETTFTGIQCQSVWDKANAAAEFLLSERLNSLDQSWARKRNLYPSICTETMRLYIYICK